MVSPALLWLQATVTVQVAWKVPTFAVIVAVPLATAVTLPVLSTVATLSLLELQVTVPSAPSGRTLAVKVSLSPDFKSRVYLFSVMPVGSITGVAMVIFAGMIVSEIAV